MKTFSKITTKNRNHSLRRSPAKRAGAYTVEFAICASTLFLLVFGLFEFSRYLFVRQAVDQAAYEAARVAIIPGANSSAIRSRAELLLNAAGIVDAEIDITPAIIDEQTKEVTVEVSCNFSNNSFLPSQFLGAGPILSRTTLDHENQAFLIPEEAAAAQSLNQNDEPQDT